MFNLNPYINKDFLNMKLGQLLSGLKKQKFLGDETLDITDLAYHTKDVKPGSCFVAIRGYKTDGHQYINDAIAKGAKAVLVEKEVMVPKGVSKIMVKDTRDSLARLSSNLFADPTLHLKLVGITGTNGKTTTAFLLENICKAAGLSTGVVTTVAVRYGDISRPAERTTPESYDLQKTFREMVDAGVKSCMMEVTSHALELKRVVDCHFDGAIFTNLSEDHLDFHQTMENYFASKAKLFRERLVVSEKKKLWAAINWDDPYGRRLAEGLPAKIFRFSLGDSVEIVPKNFQNEWSGLRMDLNTPAGLLKISSPLVGRFYAANILASVAAATALELPLKKIEEGVASFHGVPGRLEQIPNKQGFKIFVDYAHTPDALENVLRTLRGLNPKKIITVFGCGGNRDRLKRPLMGKAVDRLSDVVILTSDNPRDEEPEMIIADIVKGIEREKDFYEIVDRKEAIAQALALAKPGDCLFIAGKGHETYQEIRGVKMPFDDRSMVRELLK